MIHLQFIALKSVSKLSPILEKLSFTYPLIVSYTGPGQLNCVLGLCYFETDFNESAYDNREIHGQKNTSQILEVLSLINVEAGINMEGVPKMENH